jgi:quinol-cytochrome oxidoreductase complex cytochrome b subunit
MSFKKGIKSFFDNHRKNYPTPAILSYAWGFGSLAGFILVMQIISGLFLSMYYCSDTERAFDSVEYIMREVPFGWLVRYIHANGASAFFAIIYLHMLRGLMFSSFSKEQRLLWITGVVLFLLSMATAFLGYVLPWGQMSFWGAVVITNFLSTVPVIGSKLVFWIWGGFAVGGPTLRRFFALHFILPFVLTVVVLLHLYYLHSAGSSNPFPGETREIGSTQPLPLAPYFFIKDILGLYFFLFVFFYFVFFAPNKLGHPDNYIQANPLVTPPHIVPEWYFLPFYAMLRSIPDKTFGLLVMLSSILRLGCLPFSAGRLTIKKKESRKLKETAQPKRIESSRFVQVLFRITFACVFVILGYIGACPAEEPYITLGQFFTVFYFFFLEVISLIARKRVVS